MENDTLVQLFEFFGAKNIKGININTEINNDLEITGDDAYFLFLDFEKKFNVNLQGFNLDDFFIREMPLKYWYYKVFKPEELKKPPLTIGHLYKVVKAQYWFSP